MDQPYTCLAFLGEGKMAEKKDLQFNLYILDQHPKNLLYIEALKDILDEKWEGIYDLDVIYLVNNLDMADKENIFATPTLIRVYPQPIKRIIGDLTNKKKIFDLLMSEQTDENSPTTS